RDLRDAIVQITQLQPRVTISNRVYFEQNSPIAELALISQTIEVEHEFLHTWAGSTKRLRLHGTYTAKAGFDLRKEFSVTVTPEDHCSFAARTNSRCGTKRDRTDGLRKWI